MIAPNDPPAVAWSLEALARELVDARVLGDPATLVRGVRHDSRAVRPGDLFVARKGEKLDGLSFVPAAIAAGASAVLAQRDHAPEGCPVPMLLVDDVRAAIGWTASAIYGHPGRTLQVAGITGTNGKTTTSYLARAALDGAGARAAVLGTLGASFGDLALSSGHTTPEADDLVRLVAHLRDAGASHLVMEVSSHALAQRRADTMHYRVAAFTNLTQDHLDFHGSMEAYAQAKTLLFTERNPDRAVVNVDDPFGVELASKTRCPVLRVSRSPASRADVRPITEAQHDLRGIRCDVATPGGTVHIDSPLVGDHNLQNLLMALSIAYAFELPLDAAATALSCNIAVPGRLERCDGPGDDVIVLVDYAHTPDALERALRAVRAVSAARVLCVFGCGGDRDRAKRPVMGAIAGRESDVAILTNDNPRSEPPEAILEAVLQGLRGQRAEVIVQPDRAAAIDLAVSMAKPGEVVLIAGKGHEPYQIIGSDVRHFDDREQARKALWERRESRVGGKG